jgi:hypothetical protein
MILSAEQVTPRTVGGRPRPKQAAVDFGRGTPPTEAALRARPTYRTVLETRRERRAYDPVQTDSVRIIPPPRMARVMKRVHADASATIFRTRARQFAVEICGGDQFV